MFFSHSSKDAQLVEAIVSALDERGVTVYLAEKDPKPGQRIATKVDVALQSSSMMLVLVTERSVDAQWVQQEIGMAHAYKKFVIPVIGRGVRSEQLGALEGVEHIKLDSADPQAAIDGAARACQAYAAERRAKLVGDLVDAGLIFVVIGALIVVAASSKAA